MEDALQVLQSLLQFTLALIGLTTLFNPAYSFTLQRTCTIWTLQQLDQVGKQGYNYKYDIVDQPKKLTSFSRFVYSDIELDETGYIEASTFKKPEFDRFGKFLRWEYRGYFIHDQYAEQESFVVDRFISKEEFEACRDELLAHKTR
jgi:hypothetical protein